MPKTSSARQIAASGLILALFLLARSASAWHAELGVGPVDEVDGVDTRSFAVFLLSEHRHPWELSLGLIGKRDSLRIATPNTRFLAIGRRFTLGRGFFLASALALVDHRSEVLSSRHQFMTGIGWSGKRLTLALRHLSNANTGGRNRGENVFWLGYRLW
ncbi:MAG: hypothetical protein KatS3mg125_0890 [Lysobacterales bacterium]|nr:MAG: hypothetical protein KatS3mg125_0890 [Xanthomonadales bacterium]